MLNRIIAFSLKHRLLTVAATIVLGLVLFGGYQALRLAINSIPVRNGPTVTVVTEAQDIALEEVETLITFPIESAMNGATGVQRVRSSSEVGVSTVYVKFDWGTDIYRARQIVAEKLHLVRDRLPNDTRPMISPIEQ